MTSHGIKSVFCAVAVGKSSVKRSLCPGMIIRSAWTATTTFMPRSVQPAPNPLLVSSSVQDSPTRRPQGRVNATASSRKCK